MTEREKQAKNSTAVYTVISLPEWRISVTCYAPSEAGALRVAMAEFPEVVWSAIIQD